VKDRNAKYSSIQFRKETARHAKYRAENMAKEKERHSNIIRTINILGGFTIITEEQKRD